jgi:hypothetical protein
MADTVTQPPVTPELIAQILADPLHTKRIVIAAGQAINALANGGGTYEVQEILRHAFTNWEAVLTTLREGK